MTMTIKEVAAKLQMNYIAALRLVDTFHAVRDGGRWVVDERIIERLYQQRYALRQKELGLMSVSEFAKAAGLHYQTVSRYCQEGKLKFFVDIFSQGGQRFVRRSDLEIIQRIHPRRGRGCGLSMEE